MKKTLINQAPEEMTVRDSANAPIVFFDHVSAFGVLNGVVRVTLDAGIVVATGVGEEIKIGRVTVAHLRMNEPAARDLINALEKALALAREAAASKEAQVTAAAVRQSVN